MTAKIIRIALVVALCAAVLYGIVAGYEWWASTKVMQGDRAGAARVQAGWDKEKIGHAAAVARAVAKARAEEQEAARRAAQGEKDAIDRAQAEAAAARAAATRSAAAAGGMSRKLAALDAAAREAGSPDAASCPGQFALQRAAAIRAREVLGSCVAEYRAMGEAADGAVGALTLRLDTAMGYILAVHPDPAP